MLVSDPETSERCLDKYAAHAFFEEQGIGSPLTWLPTELPDELPYPVLVKARRGFGSRHIYRAENRAELDFFLRYTTRRVDGAGGLRWRRVLDRRLLRP